MKNIKKDIPSIVGLVATASLAIVSGGLINPTAMNILGSVGSNVGASLVANFLAGFTPEKIKKWFVDVHPNDLNHSIKKLFIQSVQEALNNISILFSETQASDNEKKQAKQLIKILQNKLPDMFLNSNQIRLEESEIKHFLYEKDKEEMICNFIENQFETFGITEPLKSFLAKNLPIQIQLCFGEGLKAPANHNAWIAFQRMLTEEIRNDIKQISDIQQSIKDDLSDLKFEKSGFSEKQISEIRKFTKILNDKKIIEVKIRSGVNQSLKSIESKANEIIRITTKTQLNVDELKTIIEKIRRQNRNNHIVIYALSVCFITLTVIFSYSPILNWWKKPLYNLDLKITEIENDSINVNNTEYFNFVAEILWSMECENYRDALKQIKSFRPKASSFDIPTINALELINLIFMDDSLNNDKFYDKIIYDVPANYLPAIHYFNSVQLFKRNKLEEFYYQIEELDYVNSNIIPKEFIVFGYLQNNKPLALEKLKSFEFPYSDDRFFRVEQCMIWLNIASQLDNDDDNLFRNYARAKSWYGYPQYFSEFYTIFRESRFGLVHYDLDNLEQLRGDFDKIDFSNICIKDFSAEKEYLILLKYGLMLGSYKALNEFLKYKKIQNKFSLFEKTIKNNVLIGNNHIVSFTPLIKRDSIFILCRKAELSKADVDIRLLNGYNFSLLSVGLNSTFVTIKDFPDIIQDDVFSDWFWIEPLENDTYFDFFTIESSGRMRLKHYEKHSLHNHKYLFENFDDIYYPHNHYFERNEKDEITYINCVYGAQYSCDESLLKYNAKLNVNDNTYQYEFQNFGYNAYYSTDFQSLRLQLINGGRKSKVGFLNYTDEGFLISIIAQDVIGCVQKNNFDIVFTALPDILHPNYSFFIMGKEDLSQYFFLVKKYANTSRIVRVYEIINNKLCPIK